MMEPRPSTIPTDQSTDTAVAARIVAAIDIGANSLRMVIAQVSADGRIEVIERLQRAVRLGQDAFRFGRLGGQNMRATVTVLRDYAQLFRLYNAEYIRAVATSAVREASNADTLLDRIFMATGLQVEVIDTAEESRLIVSAVCEAMGEVLDTAAGDTLIADVGGGSTLLTLLRDGKIITSHSLRLGSVRLQELLATSEDNPRRRAELFRQQIEKEVSSLDRFLSLDNIDLFVAVGGDARFAAGQVGQATETSGTRVIDRESFDALVSRCVRYGVEDLTKRHNLPFAEAETINPALLIYQVLLRHSQAERMLVSDVSMRDGLLIEAARNVTGVEDEELQQNVVQSALSVGEKYHVDLEHGRDVADLAVRLFDELQPDHALGPRHRLLLRAAGLLHEIGGFVSNRSHHKHSYYLIVNSEIFGLTRDELRIVALLARYHRRSPPKPSHAEYMALPRETRVVVNKLAALLRVADGFARGRIRNVRQLQFERSGDDLVVYVHGADDLLMEQRSVAAKGDLFEDIYGMRVRLEEA